RGHGRRAGRAEGNGDEEFDGRADQELQGTVFFPLPMLHIFAHPRPNEILIISEHELQRSLNQARDQLTLLQHTHDNTQAKLIDHSQKYDEEVVAKLAELDIVMMDLERANGKIVEVERKNELLRAEIESLGGGESADKSQDEQRFLQQEAEISKLIKDVETYKGLVAKTEARLTKRIGELTKDVATKTEELEGLRAKLRGFEDYDQIKRELEIMKYVEFSTGDDDDDLPAFDAGGVLSSSNNFASDRPRSSARPDTLETLLMEKNRKLQSEVTELKVARDEDQLALADTTAALTATEARLAETVALVKRLEDDLLALDSAATAVSPAPTTAALLVASPVGELPEPRASYDAAALAAGGKDDKGILPIITSQRDRFRQRNAELEEELRRQGDVVEDLRGEVSTLRADNLKLYERLKFVHVYREEKERNGVGHLYLFYWRRPCLCIVLAILLKTAVCCSFQTLSRLHYPQYMYILS
ncbi:CASP C terminal-domain-containing protein, partial [Endogone sp. FLAS-F59071]